VHPAAGRGAARPPAASPVPRQEAEPAAEGGSASVRGREEPGLRQRGRQPKDGESEQGFAQELAEILQGNSREQRAAEERGSGLTTPQALPPGTY